MVNLEILQNFELVKKIYNKFTEEYYRISTDTRTLVKGDAFVALKGEKFDAFDFLEDIIQKGCLVLVYNQTPERNCQIEKMARQHPHITFVGVDDTLLYLQTIANMHSLSMQRKNLKHVIGITGSNGKTTTKNILNHLLGEVIGEKLICTKGNLNNHIGVPLTMLGINESHEIAIVEMGTNHPGEIKNLCKIACPTDGIITNIGNAHLEFLKNQEGVFLEKRALFDSVMDNTQSKGCFIINTDDIYLKQLPAYENVSTVGINQKNMSFVNIGVELLVGDEKLKIVNHELTGIHNFYNLAVAFLMALKLFPSKKDKLIQAALHFRPSSNRSMWISQENKHIFMDAYNANPSSMQAALIGFAERCNNEHVNPDKICFVLGDMNELGENGPSLHEEIGLLIKKLGGKKVICVGRFAEYYQKGLERAAQTYSNVHELAKDWKNIKKNYDYFFIKGSRSLQLELLMDIT